MQEMQARPVKLNMKSIMDEPEEVKSADESEKAPVETKPEPEEGFEYYYGTDFPVRLEIKVPKRRPKNSRQSQARLWSAFLDGFNRAKD